VGHVLEHARAGRRVAIHHHAGMSRTGIFAARLARDALGLGGDEAIARVRPRHSPRGGDRRAGGPRQELAG
jgi:hypothetical protein